MAIVRTPSRFSERLGGWSSTGSTTRRRSRTIWLSWSFPHRFRTNRTWCRSVCRIANRTFSTKQQWPDLVSSNMVMNSYGHSVRFMSTNLNVLSLSQHEKGGSIPSILQVARLPILDNKKCQEMYLESGVVKKIRDTFLCAGKYFHCSESGSRTRIVEREPPNKSLWTRTAYWFMNQ